MPFNKYKCKSVSFLLQSAEIPYCTRRLNALCEPHTLVVSCISAHNLSREEKRSTEVPGAPLMSRILCSGRLSPRCLAVLPAPEAPPVATSLGSPPNTQTSQDLSHLTTLRLTTSSLRSSRKDLGLYLSTQSSVSCRAASPAPAHHHHVRTSHHWRMHELGCIHYSFTNRGHYNRAVYSTRCRRSEFCMPLQDTKSRAMIHS